MIKAAYRDYHLFRLDVLLEPDSEVIPYTVHLCEPVLLTKFSEGSVSPGHCSHSNKTEVWSSSRGFHCTVLFILSVRQAVLHPKTIHSPGCPAMIPNLFARRSQTFSSRTGNSGEHCSRNGHFETFDGTDLQSVADKASLGTSLSLSDMRKLHMSKFYSKILTPTGDRRT